MAEVDKILKKIRDRQIKVKERNDTFHSMLRLAETDTGMKDLLDRAEEYYILKGSPKYKNTSKGTDYPGPW